MTSGANNLKAMGGASEAGARQFRIGDEMRGERATLGKSLLDVQRDLRIRASYIAAIEDADPAAFPDAGFIPGFVKSYARYLGMEADEAYARFCAESGLAGPAPAGGARTPRAASPRKASPTGVFRPNFPMTERRWSGMLAPSVSAVGSLLVLVALLGGLGFGGWTVLQNIQRVQFAPVEELPVALASIEALEPPDAPALEGAAPSELASPVSATALADLYRRQEVEAPILTPRDGPIAAIDPERVGLLAQRATSASAPSGGTMTAEGRRDAADGTLLVAAGPGDVSGPTPEDSFGPAPQVSVEPVRPSVTVVAERAAWIRVYLADKTIVFERILETGETYSPPADIAAPLIWAGNSGSVYVRLGETLHGPLGSGTRAVKDILLEPAAIAGRFATIAADAAPEAVSRSLEAAIEQASAAPIRAPGADIGRQTH